MSPVIYRPASSGGPDRDPERPPRVSIAGPGVPTAASFADDKAPPAPPVDDLPDDLDEDPEIAEDELVDEAEDALLDDLEEGTAADALETPSEFDALDDPHFDEHLDPDPLEAPFAAPAVPQQKRRRRLLGRHDDEPVDETPADPDPDPEPEPDPEPVPVEEPVAEVTPLADEPVDEPAEEDVADEAPAARARRRRVRTLHISPPPTGPAEASAPEPEIEPETAPVEEPAAEVAAPEPEVVTETEPEAPAADPRWRQAAPRLGTPTRIPEPEALDASAGQVESPDLGVEQLEELETLVVTETEPTPTEEPATEDEDSADDSDALLAAQHRRTTPAISGHVTSTRGRGLSGMTVHLLDADGEVVAQTVTGRRGGFVVDDIEPGTYHLSAGDEVDGDFADAWFGGPTADDAEPVQVEDGITTRGVDAALPARVVIDADVDVRRKKVVVDIAVTDRTSGLPGNGAVVLSTEHFSTELPLIKGRATITLYGSTRDWDPDAVARLGKRLRVDYVGTRHTASQSRSIRLR